MPSLILTVVLSKENYQMNRLLWCVCTGHYLQKKGFTNFHKKASNGKSFILCGEIIQKLENAQKLENLY